MIGHLLGVPSRADAEQESAVRYAIQACDRLSKIYRVVFGDQAYPRAQFQLACDCSGGGQSDERVKWFLVVIGELTAHRKRGLAAGRNMRMLGEPERLESLSLCPASQLCR